MEMKTFELISFEKPAANSFILARNAIHSPLWTYAPDKELLSGVFPFEIKHKC